MGLAPVRLRHYVLAVANEAWLKSFLSTHGGIAGTVHLLKGDALQLESSPVVDIAFTGERNFSAQELQAFEAPAASLPDAG